MGGVFAGGGAVTLTVNVAGAKLNVPPVLLDVWLTVIDAEPTPTGVTVRVGVAPQLANVRGARTDGGNPEVLLGGNGHAECRRYL